MPRLILAAFVVVLFVVCVSGQDVNEQAVGMWKVNLEKSKFANPPQSVTMTIEKAGANDYREVFDVVTNDGRKIHQDYKRTFDGKERSVPAEAGATEICENLDPSTERCTRRQNGRVVSEVLGRFAPDGRTHYVVRTQYLGDNPKPVSDLIVYEKQSGSSGS